jgi:hypothetical protein
MGVRLILAVPTCLALAGCGGFGARPPAPPPATLSPAEGTVRPAPRPAAAGRTPDALDATTPAERAAAAAPATGGRVLGRTLASLGDPAVPGFWLATPLVSAPAPGRVTHASGGASVRLELRPAGGPAGGGSRMSLAAFRALGLPLTALAELEVVAE